MSYRTGNAESSVNWRDNEDNANPNPAAGTRDDFKDGRRDPNTVFSLDSSIGIDNTDPAVPEPVRGSDGNKLKFILLLFLMKQTQQKIAFYTIMASYYTTDGIPSSSRIGTEEKMVFLD